MGGVKINRGSGGSEVFVNFNERGDQKKLRIRKKSVNIGNERKKRYKCLKY